MEIALRVHVGLAYFVKYLRDVLDRFSQSFHRMKAFWVQIIDWTFFDISTDVAMATDFVKK